MKNSNNNNNNINNNNNNFVLLEGTVFCFLSSEVSSRCLCQSFSAVLYAEENVNRREGYCVKPLFTDANVIVGGHMKKKSFFNILKNVKNLRQPESLTLYL
jgi:hypothetical protein